MTALGDIELCVPRTRRFSPTAVLHAYARGEAEIDRVILAGFVLGLSTRKVDETLLSLLGRKLSATTVSRVAKREAKRDAVAQLLSYMGAQMESGETRLVRGIIVAESFDHQTKLAAGTVENIQLVTYSYQFDFRAI